MGSWLTTCASGIVGLGGVNVYAWACFAKQTVPEECVHPSGPFDDAPSFGRGEEEGGKGLL